MDALAILKKHPHDSIAQAQLDEANRQLAKLFATPNTPAPTNFDDANP